MATNAPHIEMHVPAPAEVESSLITPDMGMMLMTWAVFFLLLAVLYKFAWKPILSALDEREKAIRKSIDDADRIRSEMQNLDAKCAQIISDAEKQGEKIIDKSRKAAKEAANHIEKKAREEAQISLENAIREINEEKKKAQMELREESAEIAMGLASKLIEQNLSKEKNRSLIDKYIKKI